MSSNKIYARGDFNWIHTCPNYKGSGYGKESDFEMFKDAFYAVETIPDGWAYLADPDAVGEGGFQFSKVSSRPNIRSQIEEAILKTPSGSGHSGGSFGITMRNMEYIAKHGWDKYIQYYWPSYNPQAKPPSTTNNMLDFVTALQNDPMARQAIPNIDEQATAMRNFAAGKLSYAEMRALCG